MSTVPKVFVLIAITGMITAAVLPGRQTAKVITASFNGVSKWTKTAQGRG